MTGLSRSSGGLDARRRRLLFRSWHRGMREMDLLFGRFVEARIEGFDDGQLAELEDLLEVPDTEMLAWITGQATVPAAYDTRLFGQIKSFQASGAANAD